MIRIFKTIFLLLFLLFFFYTFSYYQSNKNIKDIKFNRTNIDEIVEKKLIDVPILENDTSNVIEFNSGFSEEIKKDIPRNFWNLLKSK